MKKVNIYWASSDNIDNGRKYLKFKPECLADILKEELNDIPSYKRLLHCPVYRSELNRTFAIRADIDYTIEYKEDGTIYCPMYNQSFFDANVHIEEGNNARIIQLFWFYFLFCEEKMEITQLPPFFHMKNIDHISTFGTYDISNWFRGLTYPIIFKKPTTLEIKRGDILYYIRFNTDKKINLVNFEYTSELAKIQQELLNLKTFKPFNLNLSMLPYYKLFKSKKIKQQIMKNIRNATLD